MTALLAADVTLSTEWVPLLLAGFAAVTAMLAFYINAVVAKATRTLNTPNGGTHLADLPKQVMEIKVQLGAIADEASVARSEAAEAKATGQVILTNQLSIMQDLLHRQGKEGNIHD